MNVNVTEIPKVTSCYLKQLLLSLKKRKIRLVNSKAIFGGSNYSEEVITSRKHNSIGMIWWKKCCLLKIKPHKVFFSFPSDEELTIALPSVLAGAVLAVQWVEVSLPGAVSR